MGGGGVVILFLGGRGVQGYIGLAGSRYGQFIKREGNGGRSLAGRIGLP